MFLLAGRAHQPLSRQELGANTEIYVISFAYGLGIMASLWPSNPMFPLLLDDRHLDNKQPVGFQSRSGGNKEKKGFNISGLESACFKLFGGTS